MTQRASLVLSRQRSLLSLGIVLLCVVTLPLPVTGAIEYSPTISWSNLFGGSGNEWCRSYSTDYGYAGSCVGFTTSNNSGNVGPTHGGKDVWVVRTKDTGGLEWQAAFGGSADDDGFSITANTINLGRFIAVGSTASNQTGQVGSNHGGQDVWVIDISSSGMLSWQKCLGGSGDEVGLSVVPSVNSQGNYDGFILCGQTSSNSSGDVGVNHGGLDVWVVKINESGIIQWQQTLGGNLDDTCGSIQGTRDRGYILTGSTRTNSNGDVGPTHGGWDAWVVKLNNSGGIEWQKSYGGNGDDYGVVIRQTGDGEYILGSYTTSSNSDDVGGTNHGSFDQWIVQLNATGTILRQRLYGGLNQDYVSSITELDDGGYVITGNTYSNNTGDVGDNHGASDAWITRLDATGLLLWERPSGGAGYDYATGITEIEGGLSHLIVGATSSTNSGDVGTNHGGYDVWIAKLEVIPRVAVAGCVEIVVPGTYSLMQDISNGTVDTCITIAAPNVTLLGNGHTINGVKKQASAGIKIGTAADRAVVQDLTLTNWEYGMLVLGPESTVRNTTATMNEIGILLIQSACHNATIVQCSLHANGGGLVTVGSGNHQIIDNTIHDNTQNGINFQSFSTNSRLVNNTIQDNLDGILLSDHAQNHTITGNRIVHNQYGMSISRLSHGITLLNNTIINNTQTGVSSSLSNEITIIGNTILNNNITGISGYDGSGMLIGGNTIAHHSSMGIALFRMNDSMIRDNTIEESRFGIRLMNALRNTVTGNRIEGNQYGMILDGSNENNVIYNNYFNNTEYLNLEFDTGSGSRWNLSRTPGENILGGPLLGGNFWAASNGTGYSQTCGDGNGDGICNCQFPLTINQSDYLPLTSFTPPIALPGSLHSPTDPDQDAAYEDLNGNGDIDFNDVVLFFEQLEWIAGNEPYFAFDFNQNGRIDFADIVMLFEEV